MADIPEKIRTRHLPPPTAVFGWHTATPPRSAGALSFSGPLVKLHVVYTLSLLSETEGAEFFTVRSTQDQNMCKLINLIRRLLPTKYYIFFKNDQTLFPYNASKYILEL